VIAHFHTESEGGALGDFQAHGAQAKNAQLLAAQGRAHHLGPFTAPHGDVGLRDAAHQGQQQRHSVVRHRRRIHPGAVGHDNPTIAGGLQVNMFVTGADHTDDFQQRQRGDFVGVKAQGAAGQHGVDLAAMALDGLGSFGWGWRQDHMKVIALDDLQVVVDGFNQDQNSGGHRTALPCGAGWKREYATFYRAVMQGPQGAGRGQ